MEKGKKWVTTKGTNITLFQGTVAMETDVHSHTPTRTRFFLGTCWVSLTAGFLLYILAYVFGYPFYVVVGILILRAAVQSLRSMETFTVEFNDHAVVGPSLFGERVEIPYALVNWNKTHVRNGRFFIEGFRGETLTARLFWYKPQSQSALNRFVHQIRNTTVSGSQPGEMMVLK